MDPKVFDNFSRFFLQFSVGFLFHWYLLLQQCLVHLAICCISLILKITWKQKFGWNLCTFLSLVPPKKSKIFKWWYSGRTINEGVSNYVRATEREMKVQKFIQHWSNVPAVGNSCRWPSQQIFSYFILVSEL